MNKNENKKGSVSEEKEKETMSKKAEDSVNETKSEKLPEGNDENKHKEMPLPEDEVFQGNYAKGSSNPSQEQVPDTESRDGMIVRLNETIKELEEEKQELLDENTNLKSELDEQILLTQKKADEVEKLEKKIEDITSDQITENDLQEIVKYAQKYVDRISSHSPVMLIKCINEQAIPLIRKLNKAIEDSDPKG